MRTSELYIRVKSSSDGAMPVSDQIITAALSANPIPGIGAAYMSHQAAKGSPPKEYWSHFASGVVPGTAAGAGAAVGAGVLATKLQPLLRRTGRVSDRMVRLMPLAIGALSGALIEPFATSAGLARYELNRQRGQ